MEMRIRLLLLTVIMFTTVILTSCQNKEDDSTTETTNERHAQLQADYEYFQSLDFSDQTIYFDYNFYILEDVNDINWYEVIAQNQAVEDAIYELDYLYRSIDDSKVTLENGVKSHLTLIYDDHNNPVVTKEIPLIYLDATKNLDGSSSDVLPRRYGFTHRHITVNEKDYEFQFDTYDDDYYGVWFIHFSEDESEAITRGGYTIANEDFRYKEKYTGPKTYYIDNVPVVRVWKVEMGYRVGVLDPDDYTHVLTDYYVYSVDMYNGRSSYFLYPFQSEKLLSLKEFYSDYNYDIEYIEYDPVLQTLEVSIHIYNEYTFDKTIVYLNVHYYTQTFSHNEIDYDIEITRVEDRILNITFMHKELDDYVFSYTLQANRIR